MGQILAKGRAVVGAGRVDITPRESHPMAGFGWSGSTGHPGSDHLFARVVYLRDAESGEEAVLTFFDLQSVSLALHQAIAAELQEGGHADLARVLVASGTHTHTAPGRFFGAAFYDRMCQPATLAGYQRDLVQGWARSVAAEIMRAKASARPANVVVARDDLFGLGANRSYAAHALNFDPRLGPPRHPGAPAALSNVAAAIDPRVTVLCAHEAGRVLVSAAYHGCHPTALGQQFEEFSRDWPGVAVDAVEHELGGLACFAQGAVGDVSPNRGAFDDLPQSPELMRRMGSYFADAMIRVVREAMQHESNEALPITLDSGTFSVQQWGSEPRFLFGVPALGGSEDGGPSFGAALAKFEVFRAEGFRGGPGPQFPKAPALGPIQSLLYGPLELSPYHPWHRLRLGDHCFVTIPGEPTTIAAREYELAAIDRLGVKSVQVVACTGDYVGYFTTPAEYDAQHYEGASTLYGRHSLDEFIERALGAPALIPARGEPEHTDLPRWPQRDVAELVTRAFEVAPPAGRRLVFAVSQAETAAGPPRATLVEGGVPEALVVRPERHPDPAGAPGLRVFSARLGAQPLEGVTLEITTAAGTTARAIVKRADAEARFTPPTSFGGRALSAPFGAMLLLAAWSLVGFAVALVMPCWLLGLCGIADTSQNTLLVRMHSLTFLLLATNLVCSKNSQDGQALLGHARAALLWWLLLLVLLGLAGFAGAPISLLGPGLYVLGGLGLTLHFDGALRARLLGRVVAPGESTEFTRPLLSVLILTAVVGGLFLLLAPVWVHLLFPTFGVATVVLFAAYGVGFVVNTLSMLGSRMSVDPYVARGQFLGSLYFDATTVLLLAIAVATQVVTPLGLVLLVPYLGITIWFPGLAKKALQHIRFGIDRPRSFRQLEDSIASARATASQVRVVGSGHSVPAAIAADRPLSPRSKRPSGSPDRHVQLDRLNRVVAVDRDRGRITVEAGMHLGLCPSSPESAHDSLILHLDRLGLALGDLGGIVHQSVAGFLSTGAAGGTTRHDATDAVAEIRLIDGTGRTRVIPRDDAAFPAALAALGLLGVLVEVTLECEPEYLVRGIEYTARVNGRVLRLPEGLGDGVPRPTEIRLTDPVAFADYLSSVEYGRILWWPQKGVRKMAIWEARRAPSGAAVAPYSGDPTWMQRAAGLLLRMIGRSYGGGMSAAFGKLLMGFFPFLVGFFLPQEPKRFFSKWHASLPMDTNVDDFVMPVEFTELWFDLDRTGEVMAELLRLYLSEEHAGAFACELYLGAPTPAWLSASQGRPCFRVDLFWFKNNQGDPVSDYYPAFWQKLAPLGFRPHFGKYLPPAYTPEGAAHLASVFPHLEQFRALRAEWDPDRVFATRYWSEHLRL